MPSNCFQNNSIKSYFESSTYLPKGSFSLTSCTVACSHISGPSFWIQHQHLGFLTSVSVNSCPERDGLKYQRMFKSDDGGLTIHCNKELGCMR